VPRQQVDLLGKADNPKVNPTVAHQVVDLRSEAIDGAPAALDRRGQRLADDAHNRVLGLHHWSGFLVVLVRWRRGRPSAADP
jgi:hypothetical protein